jgi:WD40 repeat protein|eukprot:COSAG06_NODE_677_length_13149_cov_37.657854_4_plen_137_part_00
MSLTFVVLLRSLAVAPACLRGRSSHYIATAQGEHVRIWELEDTSRQEKEPPNYTLTPGAAGNTADEASAAPAAASAGAEVWRVKWNITGTVLASSGDDGKVRLWKPDPTSGQWIERAEIVSGGGGGTGGPGSNPMD